MTSMLRVMPYHTISFIIHALIVVLAYLYSSLVMESDTPNVVDTSKTRIVGKAIRVDMVAMPKLTIQELKQMNDAAPGTPEPKPVIKEAAKGGDENTVFQKEGKVESFADRLKALSKRKTKNAKVVKKKKKAEVGNEGISGTRLKKILALGNKISTGESLVGLGNGNSGDLFDQYAIQITDFVRSKWRLPAYLGDKDLRCTIQVFISASGKLLNTKIIKTSGNSDYDNFALGAIKAVGFFPKPDTAISRRVVSGEIALGFPL